MHRRIETVPERLAELAREKDQAAISVWNDFGTNLGVGISILVNILDVKTVVVGGGLSGAWELFIEKALEEAETRCLGGERRESYKGASGKKSRLWETMRGCSERVTWLKAGSGRVPRTPGNFSARSSSFCEEPQILILNHGPFLLSALEPVVRS